MKIKIILSIFILLILGLLGLYLAFILTNEKKDVSVDDSSALYGGVAESGYQSAGYLISKSSTTSKKCGYAMLSPGKAVTAAHCVDQSESIFIGKNTYSPDQSDWESVYKTETKERWTTLQKNDSDISTIYFSDKFNQNYSNISEPTTGCGYEVVAYGRTEDPNDPPMLRKSASICISDVNQKTFTVKGDSGSGICFGDSGSPIYKKDTDQLVGIIISIIKTIPTADNPCSFDNTALAIRIDTNSDLVEHGNNDGTSYDIIAEEFTVEVAENGILTDTNLEDITRQIKLEYIIIAIPASIISLTLLYLQIKSQRR